MALKKKIDERIDLESNGTAEINIDNIEGTLGKLDVDPSGTTSHQVKIERFNEYDDSYTEVDGSPTTQSNATSYIFTFVDLGDGLRITFTETSGNSGDISYVLELHDGDSAFVQDKQHPSIKEASRSIEIEEDLVDSAGRRIPSTSIAKGGASLSNKIIEPAGIDVLNYSQEGTFTPQYLNQYFGTGQAVRINDSPLGDNYSGVYWFDTPQFKGEITGTTGTVVTPVTSYTLTGTLSISGGYMIGPKVTVRANAAGSPLTNLSLKATISNLSPDGFDIDSYYNISPALSNKFTGSASTVVIGRPLNIEPAYAIQYRNTTANDYQGVRVNPSPSFPVIPNSSTTFNVRLSINYATPSPQFIIAAIAAYDFNIPTPDATIATGL